MPRMNFDAQKYSDIIFATTQKLSVLLDLDVSKLVILIAALLLLLIYSLLKIFTYKTLLNQDCATKLLLHCQNGKPLFVHNKQAILANNNLPSSAMAVIAQHCFQHIKQSQQSKLENSPVFIAPLNLKLCLSARKMRFHGRAVWSCQIQPIDSDPFISSWDFDGQVVKQLLEAGDDFTYIKDLQGRILHCSRMWAGQFELDISDVIGQLETQFYNRQRLENMSQHEMTVLSGKVVQYQEWNACGVENKFFNTTKLPLFDAQHKVVAILTKSVDMTEVAQLTERLTEESTEALRIEAELSRDGSLLSSVINAVPEPVAFISASGRCIGANAHYCRVHDITPDDILTVGREELLHADKRTWQVEQELQLLNDGEPLCYEEMFHLADGSIRWYEVYKNRFNNPVNGENGIVITYSDLTERKKIEYELEQAIEKFDALSSIDSLTNVANRRAFDAHIKHYWYNHRLEQHEMALLFCDIDCFKLYNDNYGHQNGDIVLAQIANEMAAQLQRDTDLVARYGGEEFVVILPNTGRQGAQYIAEKILRAVAALGIEHTFSKAEKIVTLSIGIATIIPSYEDELADFIQRADKALYKAKQAGRNQFHFSQTKSTICPPALSVSKAIPMELPEIDS